jgi:hypothetical protein
MLKIAGIQPIRTTHERFSHGPDWRAAEKLREAPLNSTS